MHNHTHNIKPTQPSKANTHIYQSKALQIFKLNILLVHKIVNVDCFDF